MERRQKDRKTITIAREQQQVKGKKEAEWIWVMQRKLGMLAKDREVKWQDWRVLAYLMSCMTYGEVLPVNQVFLATELEMQQPNIHKALKRLIARGIVLQYTTTTGGKVYSLNVQYVYKGHGNGRARRAIRQRQRTQSPNGRSAGR